LDMTSNSGKDQLRVCNGELDCAADAQGHGSHTAGTAAGTSYGVAPGAFVKSIKVLGDYNFNPWSWAYGGMDWVATNHQKPAVASMSLGGPMFGMGMEAAVTALVNSGVTVSVSAGNSDGDSCTYMPAHLPVAITVGATTAQNSRWDLSNKGACVDIWAPGDEVVSIDAKSDTDSLSMSGTSMSCPHVSGGIALILQANPDLDPEGVKSALMSSTLDNVISGLTSTDTNKFLFVGNNRPPTPAPVPTPAPPPPTIPPPTCDAQSTGPDRVGDCKCKSGNECYQGGVPKCLYSGSGRGHMSNRYYSVTCEDCGCMR